MIESQGQRSMIYYSAFYSSHNHISFIEGFFQEVSEIKCHFRVPRKIFSIWPVHYHAFALSQVPQIRPSIWTSVEIKLMSFSWRLYDISVVCWGILHQWFLYCLFKDLSTIIKIDLFWRLINVKKAVFVLRTKSSLFNQMLFFSNGLNIWRPSLRIHISKAPHLPSSNLQAVRKGSRLWVVPRKKT